MPLSSGPNIVNDSIVFNYDIGDVANSYKGEPTTNLTPYSQDFSQWYGNLFGNWINSSVIVNASTAPDGTLTGNRFGDGYSRYTNSIAASTNTIYTFSVWLKNVSLTGAGVSLYWSFGLNGSLVTYGNGLSIGIGTLTNQWQRFSFSVTSPASGINQLQFGIASFTGYGSNNSGQQFDAWGGQVEQKPYATQYLPTLTNTTATRSTTQGLLDISGNNNTIDLVNMTYGANNAISFDGTDDYTTLGNVNNYFGSGVIGVTTEAVFRITPGASGNDGPIFENYRYNVWYSYGNDLINFYTRSGPPDTAGYQFAVSMTSNTACRTKGLYNHLVAIYETIAGSGKVSLYINGQAAGSATGVMMGSYPLQTPMIGQSYHGGFGTYRLNGQVPITKVYNRALSSTEVRNNYLAYKTRFNLQ